jgi:hypothetical protein
MSKLIRRYPAEDTANYAGTWPPGEPIPEALT